MQMYYNHLTFKAIIVEFCDLNNEPAMTTLDQVWPPVTILWPYVTSLCKGIMTIHTLRP